MRVRRVVVDVGVGVDGLVVGGLVVVVVVVVLWRNGRDIVLLMLLPLWENGMMRGLSTDKAIFFLHVTVVARIVYYLCECRERERERR
jgi:hypothetical protein